MGQKIEARRARTRNRIIALGAAGLVLGGGIAAGSLAAWTDVEWVTGGVDGSAGGTASTFEVEQNTGAAAAWDHFETEPTANTVDFSAAAATLTPGDTVYGFVRLRTPVDSLGGELSLVADTDTSDATSLEAALTYGAVVMDAHTSCNAADYTDDATATLVALGSALDSDGAATFDLAAATATLPGTEQTVCFALTFPASYASDDSLQGETATPVWHFDAISVAP